MWRQSGDKSRLKLGSSRSLPTSPDWIWQYRSPTKLTRRPSKVSAGEHGFALARIGSVEAFGTKRSRKNAAVG